MTYQAGPQNLSLKLPSVWGGESLKFLRKKKDSGDPKVSEAEVPKPNKNNSLGALRSQNLAKTTVWETRALSQEAMRPNG